MKIAVIGGVAAGASAACRARRVNDDAEITVFERGGYVSFANCGLPYYVAGEIEDREELLLVTPEDFREQFNIDVKIHHNITKINREEKTLNISTPSGDIVFPYDKLIIAPGCDPIIPPIPGKDLPGVNTVFTISDVDTIVSLVGGGVKDALIVGGGFIGLETAEALLHRGLNVTLVEMRNKLMTIFDDEFSIPMQAHLEDAGLKIKLETSVKEIRGNGKAETAVLSDGEEIPAQLVILAAGLKPNTALASDCGLKLGETGAIYVNEYMQTSDENIFAAGDAVESVHMVSGKPIRVSLANAANRQGRVAGNNAASDEKLRFKGTLASSVIRLHDLTFARTGLSEDECRVLGYDYFPAYVPTSAHASYYPESGWMILKVMVENKTGKLLGAQCCGDRGVEKRIDVLATAIYAGLKAEDLESLDLCYAPPYSSAKGPENMAGYITANVIRGFTKLTTPFEYRELMEKTGAELIDVRSDEEWDEGFIPGAKHVPLGDIRKNPEILPKGKPYIIYCGVGKRAHIACCILKNHGYDVYNMSGSWNVYTMDV
ncbi:MAG: FAD-dependent oxidoreductase [Oscillospiraceae bacterium]|nr:FAD-dependent oxidoreductase [Oscillospiraceae bacterium]